MKLIFAILLMSTVLCSELSSLLIDVHAIESCAMETSFEGESEKELSENFEELTKEKFENRLVGILVSERTEVQSNSLKYHSSTPYLEIHSPPPEDS